MECDQAKKTTKPQSTQQQIDIKKPNKDFVCGKSQRQETRDVRVE